MITCPQELLKRIEMPEPGPSAGKTKEANEQALHPQRVHLLEEETNTIKYMMEIITFALTTPSWIIFSESYLG